MKPKEQRARLAKKVRTEAAKLPARQERWLQDAANILDGECEWHQEKPNGFYQSCRGGWRISDRELKPTYCTDCGRLVKLVHKID